MTQERSMGITEFLRTLAPDFCFCTAFDLFLMMEQIDEDVEYGSFTVCLCNEYTAGRFERKPWPKNMLNPRGVGEFPGLYRRVSRA